MRGRGRALSSLPLQKPQICLPQPVHCASHRASGTGMVLQMKGRFSRLRVSCTPWDKLWSCHASPRKASAPRMAWRQTEGLARCRNSLVRLSADTDSACLYRTTAKTIGRISLLPWHPMGPFAEAPRLVAVGRSRMLPSLYILLGTGCTSQINLQYYLDFSESNLISWPRLSISSDIFDLGYS